MADFKSNFRRPTILTAPPSRKETFYGPLYVVSAISAVLFLFGPLFVRRGPHQGIIRCSIMLTVFSLWLFWATVYIAQMNPLLGPRMHNTSLAWVGHCWGADPKSLSSSAA